jgi:translation initiation factor 2-alpha kinase 4
MPKHKNKTFEAHEVVRVPNYEDLSVARSDEVLVLQAVYENDFSQTVGTWNCPRLRVQVKPPDVDQVWCSLTLSVQLTKQYPYVSPSLELLDVKGLSSTEQKELLQQLKDKAQELASSGTVMVIELVQVAEDYLQQHNQDPTISAYDQMKAREQQQREQQRALERQLRLAMEEGTSATRTLLEEERSSTTTRFKDPPPHPGMNLVPEELQKEMDRQRQAIDLAARRFTTTTERQSSSGDTPHLSGEQEAPAAADDDDDDEDDDDYDGGYDLQDEEGRVTDNRSRYMTDFIELGVLGRGGGGEVVKVRNRLDRRICKWPVES